MKFIFHVLMVWKLFSKFKKKLKIMKWKFVENLTVFYFHESIERWLKFDSLNRRNNIPLLITFWKTLWLVRKIMIQLTFSSTKLKMKNSQIYSAKCQPWCILDCCSLCLKSMKLFELTESYRSDLKIHHPAAINSNKRLC